MLNFFRKYQTYFFILITIVIIISFSFFGTYSTLPANSMHEQVAFTAIDGTEISRHELDEMVAFIGTDIDDKMLFGGMWGPNFLNDGVLQKDILETGLANILVETYPDLIQKDLMSRFDHEKKYTLYAHPAARFISVEGAWSYVAPDMKRNFIAMKESDNPLSPQAFDARVDLFLAEKRFPAPLLRQVLRYQQQQYNWVTPDPNLERVDLALFGYHTIDDWFGPRFVRLAAEFIINSSKIAQQKGYIVTKEEALVDLKRNAEISYQQNRKSVHLGVANPSEYFQEQLRRLGMDQTKAIKQWQTVLLFRRLFQDVGNAVIIDPMPSQNFVAFAKEGVLGELYRLPPEFRFADYRMMQQFEIYLNYVSKHKSNELSLPTAFLSPSEVKQKAPELVQKSYTLTVSQVSKSALQTNVGLRDMWDWEVVDTNWELLKKEFPDLGIKQGGNLQQRLATLDSLDEATRMRIDAFARNAIVESHPEWVSQALDNAESKELMVGIRTKGGKPLFGLENRQELILILDEAPIANATPETPKAKMAAEKLALFSGDKNNYYRIKVIHRSPEEEILSFSEAIQDKTLEQLLDRELESYYISIRDTKPQQFQKEDKVSWKKYADVKDQVADLYFEKLLTAIRTDYEKSRGEKKEQPLSGDRSATLRFYAFVRDARANLSQGKGASSNFVQEPNASDKIADSKKKLMNQWKLLKTTYQTDRTQNSGEVDVDELFALKPNEWTTVHAPVNGDLYFVQLKKREANNAQVALADRREKMHQLLSDEAQQKYMSQLIQDLKTKNAISLDYLDHGSASEMTEPN